MRVWVLERGGYDEGEIVGIYGDEARAAAARQALVEKATLDAERKYRETKKVNWDLRLQIDAWERFDLIHGRTRDYSDMRRDAERDWTPEEIAAGVEAVRRAELGQTSIAAREVL